MFVFFVFSIIFALTAGEYSVLKLHPIIPTIIFLIAYYEENILFVKDTISKILIFF